MNGTHPETIRALRGPNRWAACSVLEVALDNPAIAAAAVDLQVACGAKVSFHAAGAGRIAVEFEDEELARRCLDAALHPPADLAALRDYAGDVLLGPNTRAIFDAARLRGFRFAGSIRAASSNSATVSISAACAEQKQTAPPPSARISAGKSRWPSNCFALLACPRRRAAWSETRRTHAARAAELGCSVVVKPEAANHGRSVFIGLTDPAEIAAAYESARMEGEGTNVLVERCVPGAEHRVLVVNHRVAAATRGDELYVTGDGIRTLAQFVDELNQDPRRGDDAEAPLSPIGFDQVTLAVLARQGYRRDSIPPAGVRVLIQRNGNLAVDVTDQVHTENAALVVLAARTIGIDVAGVDLVVEDIGRPIREQGGAILEVNAMPGIMMHLRPGVGTPRPVHEIIVESVFPPDGNGRIPIIAVHAGKDSTAIAHEAARLLSATGLTVGLTAADGTFVDGMLTRAGDCASSQAAADLLLHPMIQAAVFETPDAAILGEGIAFDRCDVAIVTSPPSDATAVLLAAIAPTGKIVETAAEAVLALNV
ncbi:MAG: hypothetical protein IPP47_09850 [Bryobacterales bacterium]|nr:hypothetical protein [Bryobacterales bacterium]